MKAEFTEFLETTRLLCVHLPIESL